MKRLVLTIISAMFCGMVFISCDRDSIDPDGRIKKPVKVLFEKLETAYKKSSTFDTEIFFRDWNVSVPSNSVDSINRDKVVREIYEIYKTVYNPLDLTTLGKWEWGNDLNSNCKYVVVQNKIEYATLAETLFDNYFSIYESIKFESIDDFRPPLNLPGNQILYLTPEYEKTLNLFMGTESTTIGEGGIMTPSMPKGESDKRYTFIRPYIPVLPGHWGGYWHLTTHPVISRILIDTDNVVAKVFFRVGYQGGEAILKKKSNKWTIEKSNATWIE